MQQNYDLEELLAFAQRGDSAAQLVERLGLPISERRVQQIVSRHLGPRPTRRSVARPNVVRERVVAHMVSKGLNPRHCSACERYTTFPMAIRAVKADLSLDALVFVCTRCATPGDA